MSHVGGGQPAFHQEPKKTRSLLSQGPLQPGSGHVTRASQSDAPASRLIQPRGRGESDPMPATVLGWRGHRQQASGAQSWGWYTENFTRRSLVWAVVLAASSGIFSP